MSEGRTVQLRRYRIVDGELEAFLHWWRGRLLPARQAYGFTLESAFVVPETDEFVWAVSAEGDAAAFARLDAAWVASPERAAAFEGVPQRVASMDLRIAVPAI
ncbi:NIPSNAP family protein [Amnibacterium kyonggiense]|uniref:NIPSNAP protein n=1 Tax=Amnibacterium kyonggiense TaxID=595671 RepID=A0A4R7FGI7_9MICO|nr:NIPSNAP family protein [Amnibacterium kyonggiense]TDS75737.1 NIPSNAP protein [Amnibacterium kyonggiense]